MSRTRLLPVQLLDFLATSVLFFFFFLWPFFLRDSSLSPNFFSGWSETRFFCFDLESFFLVLLRLGQLTELNADHPINPCSRGGLPFQTSNRTKVVWTFTATDVSIHRTPVKGKKNNKIIKTTNFTKINSCFGWITGGQNILATKWYRQTGTDPSAWAPLVHFALFGWFDLLLLAASTPFGSPSIWSSFPSYGHQVAVLLLLMPNCPLPPSLPLPSPRFHLVEFSPKRLPAVTLLQVLCFLPVAYTSWLLVLKCFEMVEVLLPMNLFLPPFPRLLLAQVIVDNEEKKSCGEFLLVFGASWFGHNSPSKTTPIPLWSDPGGIQLSTSNIFSFLLFFWPGLNANSGLNLRVCRMTVY